MRRFPSRLLLAFCLAAPLAHAEPQLSVAGGEDRWSQIVVNHWAPRTRQALEALQTFARERHGLALSDEQLRFALAATPKAPVPEDLVKSRRVLFIEAGLDEAQLRTRALLAPLRTGLLSLLDQASQGQRARLPAWLPVAWAEGTARQLVAGLALPPLGVQAAPDEALSLPRRRGLAAVELLRTRLGAAFDTRMSAYLAAAAAPDFDAAAAFVAHFGSSEAELLAQADAALPAAAQSAEPFRGLPVAQVLERGGNPEIREALSAFLAAPKPRAIAFGRDRRHGIGSGSLRAMDEALKACESAFSRANCRILAVDDHIVPDPARAFVLVQMGAYANDEFSAEVQQSWLPLVKRSTSQFDRLVNEVLKVQLVRDVRVYVSGGAQDYEKILLQDMDMQPHMASLQAENTGGLSNPRGQIAVKFTPELKRAALYERAVKTPLHELTHELQKQLGQNYKGFRPPTWIIEGSADLFASLLARNLQIADGEAEVLRDWRSRNLGWWRTGNRTKLQPDDLIGVVGEEWLQMMKERRGNYQMAGLMAMYLQAVSGERFFPGWVQYFKSAGEMRRANTAFEQAFGIASRDFLEDFKRWLAQQ